MTPQDPTDSQVPAASEVPAALQERLRRWRLLLGSPADEGSPQLSAADQAIDAALAAPTKQLTVAYWQKVFGSSFQA